MHLSRGPRAAGPAPAGGGRPVRQRGPRAREGDLQLVQFERQWWRQAGAKEQAILDLFGCSPLSYYQRVNVLIDRPEALATELPVVGQLRRLREAPGSGSAQRVDRPTPDRAVG
ncbi:MAG: DUF3263 domain-containing protein [Motilibacteraceae bacterium]